MRLPLMINEKHLKGLPTFLNQQFASVSKRQLLMTLYATKILSKDEIAKVMQKAHNGFLLSLKSYNKSNLDLWKKYRPFWYYYIMFVFDVYIDIFMSLYKQAYYKTYYLFNHKCLSHLCTHTFIYSTFAKYFLLDD